MNKHSDRLPLVSTLVIGANAFIQLAVGQVELMAGTLTARGSWNVDDGIDWP